MPLNQILVTVSIVLQIKGSIIIGSASGFLYSRNDNLFLVTNQHVMRNEKDGVFPDSLRLRLHTDPNDISKTAEIDLPLYKGADRLWKGHPKHSSADVALLKLDAERVKKDFFVRAWSRENFLPANFPLEPGEDVFIMGYPLSFHDLSHNLPIFRNAMIASTYRVPFQGQPFFLIDASLHPGTSGSPVITKPKSAWVDDKGNTRLMTGTIYYLVGVHSGTIDPKITGGKEIGLGAAWYAELIEDIAAEF
jgi:S1-C subfamily serine protease